MGSSSQIDGKRSGEVDRRGNKDSKGDRDNRGDRGVIA